MTDRYVIQCAQYCSPIGNGQACNADMWWSPSLPSSGWTPTTTLLALPTSSPPIRSTTRTCWPPPTTRCDLPAAAAAQQRQPRRWSGNTSCGCGRSSRSILGGENITTRQLPLLQCWPAKCPFALLSSTLAGHPVPAVRQQGWSGVPAGHHQPQERQDPGHLLNRRRLLPSLHRAH